MYSARRFTARLYPILLATLPAFAQFHTTPPTQGSLTVDLYPTESVAASSTLVTFGVPFPRGAMTSARLAGIRVLRNGSEIPAHVSELALWRHLTDPAQDGASVRVVQIQIDYAFTIRYPNSEPITVEWGYTDRTRSIASPRDPKTAWHPVTDGVTATGGPTFGPSHGVSEPDVYAVLPKQWLAASGIKSPMAPMPDSIGLPRMDPTTVAASYPGFEEADHAQVNFFYTIINDDDRLEPFHANNTNAFLTEYEPWLYDRPMAMYLAYFRGGGFRFLREAVRNAQFYKRQIYVPGDCASICVGNFRPRNPDPNASWFVELYNYNESLATTYWLTGDATLLPYVTDWIPRALDPVRTAYTRGRPWTERSAALKWMANVVAFETNGSATARSKTLQILADLRAMQTTPYGGAADGGLWHAIVDHDPEEGATADPATSPWMSAMLTDAALRVYNVSESSETASLILGLAQHLAGRGAYWTNASWSSGANGLAAFNGGQPLRFPFYLASTSGQGFADHVDPWSDHEHSFECATTVAWGSYFARQSGDTAEASRLAAVANELYTTFSHVITLWTRPAAPASGYDAFRVNPARKYAWWFKNSSGLQWALTDTAPPPAPPAAPTVQLTLGAGSILTAPGAVNLTASAVSPLPVVRVDFYNGASLIGSDTTAPYSFAWTAVAAGSFSLTARIVDNANRTAMSAPLAVTVAAPAPASTGNQITWQQGVSGYSGEAAATITSQYLASSGGNGYTYFNTYILALRNSSYEARGLLRFDGLSLPAGATVARARLSVTLTYADPNAALSAYYLASPWDLFPALGWKNRTATASWAAPGAGGAADRTGQPVVFPHPTARSNEVLTVDLDPAIVQGWVDGAANAGLVLENPTGFPIRIHAPDAANAAYRPKLTIDYQTGVTTTPPPPSPAPSSGPVTSTYQQGAGGYQSAADVTISNQNAQYNGGNGNTLRGDIVYAAATATYTMHGLIRFDGLAAPAGTSVQRAQLTLTTPYAPAAALVEGYYLKNAWTDTPELSWLTRSGALAWAAPGASGDGADLVSGASFRIDGFRGVSNQSITVDLDPAIVQTWISNPAANAGLVLTAPSGSFLRFHSSEAAVVANRPKLTIVYQ
ncbi:MAG: DNRLRE domain-containing protein [Bryobacteraceae bacterium]